MKVDVIRLNRLRGFCMWNLRPEIKAWKRKIYEYETPLKEKSQDKNDKNFLVEIEVRKKLRLYAPTRN